MNTTPHDLLTRAADEVDVPVPDTSAILRAGRRQHRRNTLRRVTPAVGLVAASAVAAAVLIPQSPDELGAPEGVRVTEVAPAAFSAAETREVTRAYVETGAFAIGTTVYLGARDTHPVELDVPAIRGLHLTSAGVLVRHGKDLSMDVASSYSLVGTDGSVRAVDLAPGDVAVGTDAGQPYFSYARKAGQGWEVVVHDLRSGELTATVTVSGDFTWGGWDAPPVSLSGDVVWVGLDEETAAFDWRTGERVESALPGSLYPAVKGGRQVFETTNKRYETTGFEVKDARTGDVVLDVPVTAKRSTLGLLSPDGEALMMGPYLMHTEDDQIRDTRGMRVIDVASGRSTDLPASPVGGYGWTPDGHVFSVDGQQAVVCDPLAGECTTTELSLGVSPGDLGTLRLGGLVTDS
ncbi:hypothetical protein IEQ44_10455 [Nocardioides sp. Y6]|uniref:WD40 repeat domain-containing protein n=1 Tax=Nocardioides malaquae TaxID=2773426 RepID=A0ABR9RVF4_9ACTN|nr:hypothetical protein [Nocardioides malaquae]MBE7325080.1 hypothetical protein [Nocardioides malaquae]